MAVENTGLDLSNRLRRNKETANKCKKTKRSGLCFKKDNHSFGPMFMCFIITKEERDALAVVVETLASPCFPSLCSCTCLERQRGWAHWHSEGWRATSWYWQKSLGSTGNILNGTKKIIKKLWHFKYVHAHMQRFLPVSVKCIYSKSVYYYLQQKYF